MNWKNGIRATALALALGAALGNVVLAPTQAHAQAASLALPAGMQRAQTVEGITEFRLANGMKVLLAPDAADERVTVNVTYMVGSRHEGYGETGMAHLLEHLLFKGTPKVPDPKVEFQKRAMNWNGTTNADRTNYFATFQSNQETLDWYLGWQAEAMTQSFIAKKDLDSEMTVVRNEYELNESNPVQALVARMASVAYQWHNYSKMTIGAKSDIENVDIANLQAFYKRYYRPDNAVVIVAGKFDAAKTLQSIQAAFGPIAKPATPILQTYTVDTPQDGERSVMVRRAAPAQFLVAGYHTPATLHPDSPALEVLGLVLGDAPAGRLHKALVETKQAQAAFAVPFTRREASSYYFGAVIAPKDEGTAQTKTILEIVEGIGAKPITQEEFDRAKAKINKNLELSFANAASVAAGAMEMEVMGDWRGLFVRRDRLQKVTLDDVNRVAKTYLLRDNRTFGQLIPTETPVRAPQATLANVDDFMKGFALKETGEASVAFDFGIPSLKEKSVITKTPGGVEVGVLNKAVRGDLVILSVKLRMGDLTSLKGKDTAGEFAAGLLMRGTSKMTRQQIDDAVVKLGAQISITGGAHSINAFIRVKKDQLAPTLDLVAHLLKDSAFPEREFEELRAQSIKAYEGAIQDKTTQEMKRFSRYGNPYAKEDPRYEATYEEDLAAVKAIKLDEVKAFHKDFYGAHAAYVTAVGPADPKLVQDQIAKHFDGWKPKQAWTRIPYPLTEPKPIRMELETPDKANATIRAFGKFALRDTDDEALQLTMAMRIFGGGPGSRLWERMREKDGLSYSAGAGVDVASREPNSSWEMFTEVNPANLSKAEVAMKEELAKALKDGFTLAELARFKEQTLRTRRERRTGDDYAFSTLGYRFEYPDRPWELALQNDAKYEAMTLEQVNAAFRKFAKPDSLVWGLFRDATKAK